MIVNLPIWSDVVNGASPWVSGALTSFLPAAYWEIGLAAGVGVIGFAVFLISGGLDSLLGAFGSGSDPMRGIPSGNSGLGYTGRSGRSGRSGGAFIGGVGRTSMMGSWAGRRWTRQEKMHGITGIGPANPKYMTANERHELFKQRRIKGNLDTIAAIESESAGPHFGADSPFNKIG